MKRLTNDSNGFNRNRKIRVSYFPTKLLSKILTWLSNLTNVKQSNVMPLLKVLAKIAKVYDTRGKTECIKYSKQLRQATIKFLSGGLNEVQSTYPKILAPFKDEFSVNGKWNYPLLRLILTVTYSTRFIRLKENPSLESIEKTPGYDQDVQSLVPELKVFLKRVLGVNPRHFGKVTKNLKFKRFHMTSKSGPSGKHALWSSAYDVDKIPDKLKAAIEIVAGSRLPDLMDRLSLLYSRIPGFFEAYVPQGTEDIRKITAIRDKEGKTREVAILDYYSQSALRPLHKVLYRLLSRINQDCTHDQIKWLRKLVPRKGSSFHSIDLTTATDRFPIEIEELILSTLYGREYAQAWKSIMVGFPFRFQDRKVIYGTGNPMGAYSSWATFAIAHHFFVFLACRKAARNALKCPYMLLGDDIVIADDKVASEYKKLLLEWDIPFSEEKTHTSPYYYEFAKNHILDNENISPFPIAALYERRNSLFECVSIIVRELSYKNWDSDIWDSVELYLTTVRGLPYPRVRKLKPGLKLSIALLFHLQGKAGLGTAIKEYVAAITGRRVKWSGFATTAYEQWISGNTVTDLFDLARKRVTSNSFKEPLGELATNMVVAITSLRSGGEDCFDLIEAVPFLQIYGRAEERFLQLSKPSLGARLIRDGSQMRSALEVVDIPLSDRDFYVRNRDVIVIKALKASKIIGEKIREHMKRNNKFHTDPLTLRKAMP